MLFPIQWDTEAVEIRNRRRRFRKNNRYFEETGVIRSDRSLVVLWSMAVALTWVDGTNGVRFS